MSNNLKIKNLSTSSKIHPLKHTFLPNLPMRMLVIAPSNGGKSNMLKNMLLRSDFGYKNYFTEQNVLNYFIFSRTLHADPTWDSLVKELPKLNITMS